MNKRARGLKTARRYADGGGVADPLAGMSPTDLIKLRAELAAKHTQPGAGWQTAEEFAGALPVIGNVMSARDAITSAGDAYTAASEGRYKAAAGNAALAGIGALGAMSPLPWGKAAGAAARDAGRTMSAFDVWHGSPHKFTDEFRMDKLGTGEGAQVYGHGLYFAESPKVAEHYRDQLGELRIGDRVPADSLEQMAAMQKLRGRLDDTFVRNWEANLARATAIGDEPAIAEARRALAVAQAVRDADVRKHGYVYRARVDAEPEDFLDLELPLSKQSPKVQEALIKLGYEPVDFRDGRHVQDDLNRKVSNEEMWLNSDDDHTARLVSDRLKSVGIPGNRYHDSMSRDKGGGTRNYVVWDDDLLKVQERLDAMGNPFARGGAVMARARRYANGGGVIGAGQQPATHGAIRGATDGRGDALSVAVPPGSYVVPADVVSALGGGNTEAGMTKLADQFGQGAPQGGEGGGVPIQISHGEFVVSPDVVEMIGGPDVMDAFVVRTRARYADQLQRLPGPNK